MCHLTGEKVGGGNLNQSRFSFFITILQTRAGPESQGRAGGGWDLNQGALGLSPSSATSQAVISGEPRIKQGQHLYITEWL